LLRVVGLVRCIAAREVDDLIRELLAALTGTTRVVVDLDAGIRFPERLDRDFLRGLLERRAGCVEGDAVTTTTAAATRCAVALAATCSGERENCDLPGSA